MISHNYCFHMVLERLTGKIIDNTFLKYFIYMHVYVARLFADYSSFTLHPCLYLPRSSKEKSLTHPELRKHTVKIHGHALSYCIQTLTVLSMPKVSKM